MTSHRYLLAIEEHELSQRIFLFLEAPSMNIILGCADLVIKIRSKHLRVT
jgi:hypothetical protein